MECLLRQRLTTAKFTIDDFKAWIAAGLSDAIAIFPNEEPFSRIILSAFEIASLESEFLKMNYIFTCLSRPKDRTLLVSSVLCVVWFLFYNIEDNWDIISSWSIPVLSLHLFSIEFFSDAELIEKIKFNTWNKKIRSLFL